MSAFWSLSSCGSVDGRSGAGRLRLAGRIMTKIPNSPGRVCRDNVPDVTDTDLDQPSDHSGATIIYTRTDEAPLLATYSFLPIIQAFTAQAGVSVETRDISLAGRIIAQFPERLTDDQRQADALAELGALAKTPEANIIKLPNISASVPQLKAAIAELQGKGYDLPDYPDNPTTDEEKDVRSRYDKVKGSAVNPVLREGNSDRRAPASVKQYARNHPHSMGAWSPDSKTNVAHMTADDFRSSETSAVMDRAGSLRIELVADDGTTTVLRESVPVLAGEVVDATALHVAALTSSWPPRSPGPRPTACCSRSTSRRR